MAKVKIFYNRMPDGSTYIKKERSYGTTYKQNKKTGRMEGRKSVKGKGDKTGVRRVVKDFIVVRGSPGKRGYVRKRMSDGYISGRH